jgi:hypothetical protein
MLHLEGSGTPVLYIGRRFLKVKHTPVNGASNQTFTPCATLNKFRFCHSAACDVSVSEASLWHSRRAIHNGATKFSSG